MPPLREDEVRVFLVLVTDAPEDEALAPDERRRAAAFRRDEDRRRFVTARQALREILAAHAGVAPGDIAFDATCARCGHATHGKPRLAHPPGTDLRFSASHSGDVVLVALARGREVGVDVERVRADFDPRDVARMLGPSVPTEAQAFHEAWTRREAVLKLTGAGLAEDLAAPAPPGVWTAPLSVPAGHAACLAAEGPPCRVVLVPWP